MLPLTSTPDRTAPSARNFRLCKRSQLIVHFRHTEKPIRIGSFVAVSSEIPNSSSVLVSNKCQVSGGKDGIFEKIAVQLRKLEIFGYFLGWWEMRRGEERWGRLKWTRLRTLNSQEEYDHSTKNSLWGHVDWWNILHHASLSILISLFIRRAPIQWILIHVLQAFCQFAARSSWSVTTWFFISFFAHAKNQTSYGDHSGE
jgi:hypothetical protein